ncbi:YopX family protein [Lentilactobacillus otakiensis]|uniref:YopX family protein n=1 Tax=Lentilactobacillus TaxID=2767893 RepID=UPI00080B269E|nr:YopX family protein [Lentilactobacillus parabuchneri]MBW0222317.1 YopX family protein [Lentilactobacillus parabuchneri]OCB82412.1 hypothetical protein A7322_00010 [Lentilactobacillus parabuchneri]
MNRQIKFRAWDSDQKRMLKVYRISFDGPIEGAQAHCYLDDRGAEGSKKCFYDGDGLTLEQFTGLKDKNGKEIYEGDILAWHSNIYRKHDWVGLVLYRGAGFAVQESDKSYSSPEWLDCACRKDANIIEVIGNIHENPELLEAEK